MRFRPYLLLAAAFCFITLSPSLAAETESGQVLLSDYLESLIAKGARIIYSSDLVTDDMVVKPDSASGDPIPHLSSMLEPFDLSVSPGPSGSILIVALPQSAEPRQTSQPVIDNPILEIVVTSSLRQINSNTPSVHTYLDSEFAARVPVTGDEVVRLAQRLPGTASGGVSSKTHVRGGEENEMLFLFDGLRLYEPYHLRDFQSVASIINSSSVDGIDFYTGAYPARYGDRMSGVLSIEMREPARDRETELAISFFNASAVSMGRFGPTAEGNWLVSGRRGNLDLITDVIDPERGSPDYSDFLGHVSWEFGPRALISGNVLISDDKIRLFNQSRGEQARARYSNSVGWLKWDAEWTSKLRSTSIIAASDVTDERHGTVSLPGIVSGELDDQSDLKAYEFRQDWTWVLSENWMWSFGANLKHLDADYKHESDRFIEAPFDAILDNEPGRLLDFERSVDGAQYAAYSEVRWRASDTLIFDAGLRWDHQTYTTANNDRQYSPRASFLWDVGNKTEIRLGWGQYYQAQETNELQLSDGVEEFFPAQRAEHVVTNIRHQVSRDTAIELSVFRKSFRTLRPRFENLFNRHTLVPEIQFDRIIIDPQKAESVGAELTVTNGTSADSVMWWATYGWAKTRDWTDEGKVVRSWDQTHSLKTGLSWTNGRWDLSAALEVHTGWPENRLIPIYQQNPDGSTSLELSTTPRNELRYPTFGSLDFRAARSFDVRRGELTVFLEVTNILDLSNPCCVEYSLSSDGELAARTSHWLPIVPSLGVVWRF